MRIYIEQAFRRTREFKIFRKQVKLSQLGLIGKMFLSVCFADKFSGIFEERPK